MSYVFDKKLVKTKSDFQDIKPTFFGSKIVSLDFETKSLDDLSVLGVGLACVNENDATGCAVYIGCESDCELSFLLDIKPFLYSIFLNTDTIIGHNLKFDLHVLRKHGFDFFPNKIFDTMVGSWLLSNGSESDGYTKHSLHDVANRFLGVNLVKDLLDIRKETDRDSYWQRMFDYGVNDVILPIELWSKMQKLIIEYGIEKPTYDLEMHMPLLTGELEQAGLYIDKVLLQELQESLLQDMSLLEKKIIDSIGIDFLLSSSAQLSNILFDNHFGPKLTPKPWMERSKAKGSKQGLYSSDESVLKAYADEYSVCKDLLEYRAKSKLLSTYVQKFLELAQSSPDGRIRSSFHQTGTTSGRYSSSGDFNAQNMPRQKGTIRKAIIPAKGFTLVSIDYSQIELRIMAHQSRDPLMIDLYNKGQDIHAKTASESFNIPISEVTKEHRQGAKAVNFGFLYGMSSKKFVRYAQDTYGVSFTEEQAEDIHTKYFQMYKGVKIYHETMREFIAKKGYVSNIIGERRWLPDHKSKDTYKNWQSWSAGINHTIQSSAAALMKTAMLSISKDLYRPFGFKIEPSYNRVVTLWNSNTNLAHEVRMILQVHDELVFEVRDEIVLPFAEWAKHKMETAMSGFIVPIVAEYKIGKTLEDCK